MMDHDEPPSHKQTRNLAQRKGYAERPRRSKRRKPVIYEELCNPTTTYVTQNPPMNSMEQNISNAKLHATPLSIPSLSSMTTKMINDSHFKNISLQYFQSLSSMHKQACLDLFSLTMTKLYTESSWGLDMKIKEEEFTHSDARFLLLFQNDELSDRLGEQSPQYKSSSDGSTFLSTNFDESSKQVLAFCHFRFESSNEGISTPSSNPHELMYLYEIQIHPSIQRSGLGMKLMMILETMAAEFNMKQIVLTVFKNNTKAMRFYIDKMKYSIDKTSPSEYGQEADYEILSKVPSR